MEDTRTLRFFNRGPSAVARLVFFSVLSLFLLFVDARFKYLESTRQVIAVIIYPLQKLTSLPGEVWNGAGAYISLQRYLVADNAQLHQQHDSDAAQLQQLQVVQAENAQLRALLEVKQRDTYGVQMAQIAYIERDIFKRKLLLDKGTQSNVQAGQAVVDNTGVVGQVTRVYPWLSEVTLVTDKDIAVPIQVVRNGLRAVVFGSGNISELDLRYQPINADIEVGDVLVTSGMDGTYPPALAVAKVTSIDRDPAYPFARIACLPLAGVDRHRTLLIVSSVPPLPERPASEAEEQAPKRLKNKAKRSQP
ncbi:MAG: rod shape-determining protein MreC [Sideroxydans sp.]|nr:rod shape-determining protein MreC [Sideroxydans sp.]NOT98430.1 rod shape-determining protein MreC [Sideroxydans sp.]